MNWRVLAKTSVVIRCSLEIYWRPFECVFSRWLITGDTGFQRSASVKETELEKFSQFDWWKASDDLGSLQHLNPIRCRFINTVTSSWFDPSPKHPAFPLKNKSVLDVGCGAGIFTESLARLGGQILGIDVIQRNIDEAQKHLVVDPRLQDQIQYKCISAEELINQGLKFDVVIASEVVEHVKDPMEFLRTLLKLMEPKGLLCLTTINRTWHSWIGAIFVAERIFHLLPKGTHDWKSFITPDELSMAGKQIGLTMEHLVGFELSLLTKKWKFSNDVSINYGATFSKKDRDESEDNDKIKP